MKTRDDKKLFTREFTKILIPLVIAVIAPLFIVLFTVRKSEINELLMDEKNTITEARTELVKSITAYIPNLQYQTEYLARILNYRDYNEISETGKEKLLEDLMFYAQNTTDLIQIRFIDKTGMERIKIVKEDDDYHIFPEDMLIDKSSRDYYIRASEIEDGVYISPVELNIEFGEIEVPQKPVIRLAVPVQCEGEETTGILIISIDMRPYFEELKSLNLPGKGDLRVINSSGYWIIGPSDELEWQFMHKEWTESEQARIDPGIFAMMKESKTGKLYDNGNFYVYDTLFTDSERMFETNSETALHTDGNLHIMSILRKSRIIPEWWGLSIVTVIIVLVLATAISYSTASSRASKVSTDNTIRENELRLKMITETVADGIVMLNREGLITFWNSQAEKIFGYTKSEALGRKFHTFLESGENGDKTDIILTSFYRGFEPNGKTELLQEFSFINNDDEKKEIEIAVQKVDDNTNNFIIAAIRDITLRKKEEDIKRKLTERLRLALSASGTGTFEWNFNVNSLTWDKNMLSLYDVEEENFTGDPKHWFNAIHPDDREWVTGEIYNSLEKSRDTSIVYRIITPKNNLRYIKSDAVLYKNEDGQIISMIGSEFDITQIIEAEEKLKRLNEDLENRIRERTEELEKSNRTAIRIMQEAEVQKRKAEGALEELKNSQISLDHSEKKYKELIENLNELVWEIDRSGKIIYTSPHVESITGLPLSFVNGKNVKEIFPKDIVKKARRYFAYSALKKRPVHSFEHEITTTENKRLVLEASFTPIIDVNGKVTGFRGVSRDITAREEADVQIKKLSMAIEAAPVSVIITDREGIIEYVNPVFEKVTGYSREEAIGKNPRVLKSDIHPGSFYSEMWNTLSSDRIWSGEICNRKKDGILFWELASISPIHDSEGIITHYVAVKDDITDQKKIRSSLELTQFSVDSAADAIFWLLTDASLYYVNNKVCQMLGYSREELLSRKIFELEWKEEPEEDSWNKFLNEVRKNPSYTFQSSMIRKTGEIFPVEVVHAYKEIDGTEYIFVNMRDITQRKLSEETMEQALRKAQEATKAKSDFLANMSHEIRTPMNAIIGMTYLVSQTKLTETQQNYVETISMSAKTLLDIINEILDFSKIEAGKIEIESIDFSLEEVIKRVIAISSHRITEKGLHLLVDIDKNTPGTVIGDSVRLGQILNNLLSNAVKFTESGKIEISTEIRSMDDTNVSMKFSVSDTGIGLSEKEIEQLFTPFRQADTSTTRKYGGTGLGLSISQQLANLMGGAITVKSTKGKGSEFSFSLTFGYKPETTTKKTIPLDLRNLRVLIVCEDTEYSDSITHPLQGFSFDIRKTSDWITAAEYLKESVKEKTPFELIVVAGKVPEDINQDSFFEQNIKPYDTPLLIIANPVEANRLSNYITKEKMVSVMVEPVTVSDIFNEIISIFGYSEAAEEQYEKESSESIEETGIDGTRILIAEDNRINQILIKELLKNVGISPDIAEDGESALAMITQKDYDLVFMDIQMPGIDGFETTRRIRNLGGVYEKIPVLAMTAHAMNSDRDKSLSAGMNDHITKPINPEALYESIRKWTQKPEKYIPENSAVGSSDMLNSSDIDFQKGLRNTGGNMKLYREFLNGFLEDYSDLREKIAALHEEADNEPLFIFVHTMKGLTGTLGFNTLYQSVKALENMIKTSNSAAGETADKVFEETATVFREIRKFLSNAAETNSEHGRNEKSDESHETVIKNLKNMLKIHDASAADYLEKRVNIFSGEMRKPAEELLELLNTFKFREALDKLKELSGKSDII